MVFDHVDLVHFEHYDLAWSISGVSLTRCCLNSPKIGHAVQISAGIMMRMFKNDLGRQPHAVSWRYTDTRGRKDAATRQCTDIGPHMGY